jgi:hypothetical protein
LENVNPNDIDITRDPGNQTPEQNLQTLRQDCEGQNGMVLISSRFGDAAWNFGPLVELPYGDSTVTFHHQHNEVVYTLTRHPPTPEFGAGRKDEKGKENIKKTQKDSTKKVVFPGTTSGNIKSIR